MSPFEWLAQPAGRIVTLALLHFVWQGLAIALLLTAAVELARVRTAAVRYSCSLAALVLMATCPLVTLTWLRFDRERDVSPALTVASPQPGSSFELARVDPTALLSISRDRWIEAVQPYALAAWLGGVTMFGCRLSAGVVGLARLRRGRLPLPWQLADRVERLGRRLQIDAAPVVFLSLRATQAMAVGLLRPLVLVPVTWAMEMPADMLEAVIAHELAHLRRRDLWVILLQRIVETVLFYHPAVWWLSRRMRIERELCADDLAVAATGQRLVYAQTLEQIARERRADGRTALAAFVTGEREMRLLQRVRNVLELSSNDRSRPWPAGLAALALPALLWVVSPAPFSGPAPAVAADEQVGEQARDVDSDAATLLVNRIHLLQERRGEEEGDAEPQKAKRANRRQEVEVLELAPRERQGDARVEELTALVKQLASRVENLQAEVAALRSEKGASKPATTAKPTLRLRAEGSTEAEKPKVRVRKRPTAGEVEVEIHEKIIGPGGETEDEVRKRKSSAAGESPELNLNLNLDRKVRTAIEQARAAKTDKEALHRAALDGKIRAAIEQGQNVKIDKEAIERAVQQALESTETAIDKEALRRSVEQAIEGAQRAREQALEAAERAKAQGREAGEKAKQQAREQAERAKEQAAEAREKRAKEEEDRRREEERRSDPGNS